MYELVLASQSPRRKQILEERGYKFRTFPIEVSEILDKSLNIPDRISRCAQDKAEAAWKLVKCSKSDNFLILAADTVVVLEEDILGKPQSSLDARETLLRLSGKEHQVITGFCLIDVQQECIVLGHEITEVQFRPLNFSEIDAYIATGEPMDKAGAYGIQGEGRHFVEKYHGSYLNIVGLPIEKIEEVCRDNNWQLAREIQ